MPDWNAIKRGGTLVSDIRLTSVRFPGITLYAIEAAGNTVYLMHPANWRKCISVLSHFDWHRSSPECSVFLIGVYGGKEKEIAANHSAKKNLTDLITNKIIEIGGGRNGEFDKS